MTEEIAIGIEGFVRRCMLGFLLGAIVASSGRVPAAAAAPAADSTRSFIWSALYRNRLLISKSSEPFPWNDEAPQSHINDRLAVLGSYRPGEHVAVFAKGATGFRLNGEHQETQFALEQGHLGVTFLDGAVEGKLFSREKIFRTGNRLLPILSNDADFVRGRGEGFRLDIGAGSHLSASYLESVLRSTGDVEVSGGLPLFRGGADAFRLLCFELRDAARWHAGGMLSRTRSTVAGDVVMVGADVGLRVLGIDLMAELARSSRESWSDLFTVQEDAHGGGATVDDASPVLSQHNAFAAEAALPNLRSAALGSLGLVAGRRFCGAPFRDPAGELETGLSETYANAWWRHPRYDAVVSVEAADGERMLGGEYRRLIGNCRMRYRGGFELREGVLCMTGAKPSALLSLFDENRLSRVLMTARVDDLGGGDVLSFYAEGGMNVGARVTIKGALYLYRSEESFYNVELEFRPAERFILRAAIGSFAPADDDIMLNRSFDFGSPFGERTFLVFARIWFGSI